MVDEDRCAFFARYRHARHCMCLAPCVSHSYGGPDRWVTADYCTNQGVWVAQMGEESLRDTAVGDGALYSMLFTSRARFITLY